ncbi:MAG: hypothetical protein PHN88_04235 [Ignavibacteria bacterium]|nr:hypothetical protein [Ignavibacteria bacterium]
MKISAKVIFKPDVEVECSWVLSINTINRIKKIWKSLESNTLELTECNEFGYKGIKVECDTGLNYYVTHNSVIQKESFVTSVKNDTFGKIENLLLRSMPDSILCFVKPYVFADIVYKKAK